MTLSLETKLRRFHQSYQVKEGCWIWAGKIMSNGYGSISCFKSQFKTSWAHRVSYLIHNGEIAAGLEILHSCNQRNCVNPQHLSLGTRKENMAQASREGRLLHWKRPLGEKNVSSKLTEESAKLVTEYLTKGVPKYQVAKLLGISRITVYRVSKGLAWKHLNLPKIPNLTLKVDATKREEILKLKGLYSQREIAKRYGVSRQLIQKILS